MRSLPLQAEPKDNDPYNPPGGNYFLSTYNRIGTLYDQIPNSETHDMLEQIWTKPDYETIYPRKPLVNFVSYNSTEIPTQSCNCKDVNLPHSPHNYNGMCYQSTMKHDYQPTNLQLKKSTTQPTPHFLLNRLCLSELNDGASIRRLGINKFLDDRLSDFYKNKEMKQWRYSSYDPNIGRYTHEKCCKQN